MARLDHLTDDDCDSESSFSPEDDLFDEEDNAFGSDTEATDIELFGGDDDDDNNNDDVEDVDIDIGDPTRLFDGNLRPPEHYRRGVDEFDDSALDDGYAEGTTRQLDSIEKQWKHFCTNVLLCEPKACFESVSVGMLYQFFDWFLNQKVGKGGRKKKGTKKQSSLGTDWKQFRLVYERVMEEKLDPKLNRRMHKVLRELAKKHELSSQRRKNRCMTIDSLKEQVEATLSTTEKSFELGEIRILAVLFLLLLAPAGARPQSILRLRFGDVRIVLTRDPEGGPHNIMIHFTLEFTKTYLGDKDANTFYVPETMFDPSLLLSPHNFLLGILFRHRAFRAPSLVSPQQLDNLDIHPGELELPIPLRADLDKVCIFRRAVQTLTGYELSPTEPVTYAMMAGWTKKIGEIMGLELGTIPYNLRYNAGNEFDQSGNVSDALRNLMLGHASSNTFQKHYLGREICADTWGILRGRSPQQRLVKQSCSVAHSISKRRPLTLTAEQSASVSTHPHARRLTRELQGLRQGSRRYMETRRELRNTKQTLRRSLRQRIRAKWTDSQAVNDIECQLRGNGLAEPVAADVVRRPQLPAQKRLVAALTAPVEDTLEGNYRRRDHAIEETIAYCTVQEGRTIRTCASLSTNSPPSHVREPPQDSPVFLAAMSVFVEDEGERPRRCFLCIGAAFLLEPDDPSVKDLIHEFYTPSDLSKHFRRRHLRLLQPDTKPECQLCNITLSHKMHLQSHAMVVHGTVS